MEDGVTFVLFIREPDDPKAVRMETYEPQRDVFRQRNLGRAVLVGKQHDPTATRVLRRRI